MQDNARYSGLKWLGFTTTAPRIADELWDVLRVASEKDCQDYSIRRHETLQCITKEALYSIAVKGLVFQKVFQRNSTSYCRTSGSITIIKCCKFTTNINVLWPTCEPMSTSLWCSSRVKLLPKQCSAFCQYDWVSCKLTYSNFSLANCARIWGRPALSWAIKAQKKLKKSLECQCA